MNTRLITAVVLVLATGLPLAAADKGAKKGKGKAAEKPVPEFTGQPNLARVFQLLNRAKAAVEEGKEPSVAIEPLHTVGTLFKKSIGRGNFIVDMHRFAELGIKHLEKGETDKALEDIESAITACNKAGRVGQK